MFRTLRGTQACYDIAWRWARGDGATTMQLEQADRAAAKLLEVARLLKQLPAFEESKQQTVSKPPSPPLLSLSPRQYRAYADEWNELARTATDDQQRALYLKMANIWSHAAHQFENGLDHAVSSMIASSTPGESD